MKKWFLIGIVVIVVWSMISTNVESDFYMGSEVDDELNDNNSFNELHHNREHNSRKLKNVKFELEFDYILQQIRRDGQKFNRILIDKGGIECGAQGEELPFLLCTLTTYREIEHINVVFKHPIKVCATPTPYLIPPTLGSNNEMLANNWKGQINDNINARWSLNHLSQTTMDHGLGEIYSLKIYPVEFDADGNARVYEKAEVTYSEKQNMMWSSNAAPDPGHKPTGPVKYLIITHSDLEDAVTPFARWKSQKGLFTYVATVDEIDEMYDIGDLPAKMRKYIQMMEAKYDLEYLLLVGDWDLVPTRNTKNSYAQPMMGEPDTFASDLYFACVDPNTTWNKDGDADYAEEKEVDDCVPDMANGRLAINSATVLSSIIKGLITREKELQWDSNADKAVYMCGDPGYMPGDPTAVMEYFYAKYGQDVFSGNVTIFHDDTGSLPFTSRSFKQVIDDRHQAMCYFGHGKPDEIPNLYTNSQVRQLLDNGTDGSLFAMACLTGWFDDPSTGEGMGAVDNCFAEMMTETPGKGVAGYIGSSRIAVGFIDTTYSADAPGLEEDYWRSIENAAKGNLTPTIGAVWRDAVTHFTSSFFPFQAQGFDNPGLRTFLEYNLLGEPDAPLILREPEELQLEFELSQDQASIWARVTNATSAPVGSATVCIYRDNELGRAAKTNSKGEVTITIPPNNGGVITITASRVGDKTVNDTFTLPDNLAPEPVHSITPEVPSGNNSYYKSQPCIRLFGDEPVNIEYRWDNSEVFHENAVVTLTAPEGNHTLYFRVVDSVGQWSEWKQVNLLVDTIAPELVISTEPASPDGDHNWYITKPLVSLNSPELLQRSYYRIDDGQEKLYNMPIPLDEGIYNISFIAYDLAGNKNITEATIKVDISAPKSVLNLSHPPDGNNDYYVTLPEITLTSPDEQDATFEYRWDTEDWLSYEGIFQPTEGVHTLYYRAVDIAGNVEIPQSYDFKVDMSTPELKISSDPKEPNGDNGYYTENPVIDINVTEGEVYYVLAENNQEIDWEDDSQKFDENIIIPTGNWRLLVKAVDPAGNEVYMSPMDFKVDMTPPEINWGLDPSSPDGNNGWYTTSPSVDLTSVSQDTTVYWNFIDENGWNIYNDNIELPSGVHRIKFKAVDIAGNVIYRETEEIHVDLLAPDVSFNSPRELAMCGTMVFIEWSSEEAESGIYQYKIKLDKGTWEEVGIKTQVDYSSLSNGKHTVHLMAYDKAGNSIKESREFIVDANAPQITAYTPKCKDVQIGSQIEITFSEQMQKATVMLEVDGMMGAVTWNNNTVIFTPTQNLKYSTQYKVKVTGLDLYDNSLKEYSWSFTTENAPEVTQNNKSQLLSMIITILVTILVVAIIVSMIFNYHWYKKQKNKRSNNKN